MSASIPDLGAWVSDFRFSESNHRQFYRRWAELMTPEAGRAGRRAGAREAVMRNEDLIREVEQFLYREARLLDERRFHEWLTLFTDDVRYWMPAAATAIRNRARRSRSSTPTATSRTT